MRIITSICLCMIMASACAQHTGMDFETYNPKSTLVVPEHKLSSSKYPFIDVHNHQWDMGTGKLKELVTDMDKLNMKVMVNLSGGGGSKLKGFTDNVKNTFPKRFMQIIIVNIPVFATRMYKFYLAL